MTFHNVASRLAAQGRGPDTMLVHMAPEEVRGLSDLAMAAGGSLTINPTTGLPEAGFLKRLLPTLIGAGLSFIPGVGPLMAAGLVGGFETVRTGDLSRGLMAGLGAYGGAGLAGGLTAAGVNTASQAAALGDVSGVAGDVAAQAASMAPATATAGQGISNLASSGAVGEAARSGFMSGVGGLGGLARYGLAASSPVLNAMGQMEQPQVKPTPPLNRYEYQARPLTPMPDVPGYGELNKDFGRQRRYFDPRYVDTGRKFVPGDFGATPASTSMAEGGKVTVPNYDALLLGQDLGARVASAALADSPASSTVSVTPADVSGAIAKYAFERTPISAHSTLDVPSYEDMMLGQDFGRQRRYYTQELKPLALPEKPASLDEGSGTGMYEGGGGDGGDGGPQSPDDTTDSTDAVSPALAGIGITDSTDALGPGAGLGQGAGFGFGGEGFGMGGIGDDGAGLGGMGFGFGGEGFGMGGIGDDGSGVGGEGAAGGGGAPAGDGALANGGSTRDALIAHGSASIGNNTGYPLVETPPTAYNTASNRPQQMELLMNTPAARYDFGTGQARFAEGGISHLGSYSDGGRMLRGPGDGVSDSIPATIGDRQPARLADGEFVIPARIVSEIGNGSSEAGARKLYAMMDRVQGARKKSIGKGKVAVDSKAEKLLPA